MITLFQDVSSATYPPFFQTTISVGSGGSHVDGPDSYGVQTYTVTGASTWKEFQFSLVSTGYSFRNLTPNNLSVSASGKVSRTTGTGGAIGIIDPLGLEWMHTFNFDYVGSGTYSVPRGFAIGSPARHCFDIINSLLSEGSPKEIFSSYNHTTASYMLNPTCWAHGFDFSGVTVWSSRSNDFWQCGTAITRRHLWMTWHFRLSVYDTVKFRRSDGVVETYTIIAINPGSSREGLPLHDNVAIGDYCIALLDRPLHSLIKHYPIAEWAMEVMSLPTSPASPIVPDYGWGQWAPPETSVSFSGAFIYLNKFRQASVKLVAEIGAQSVMTGDQGYYYGQPMPIYAELLWLGASQHTVDMSLDFRLSYSAWETDIIQGDSSSPVFCPLSNNSLAIATCLSTPDMGWAPNVSVLNTIIRATDETIGSFLGYYATAAPDPTL